MSNHQPWCRQRAMGHTDAAKRIADTYNLHRMAGGFEVIGKWFAAALADGRTDDTLYDSKSEAVRFQKHNEQWYTFVKLQPCSMDACEAEVLLTTARTLYDKGLRLADPDHAHGGMDVITRTSVEDQLAQSVGRNTNLIMPWEA